jgi:pyruvate/2-oxoglutarate dehydrogenase complex dihydrolipoamide dehydrogenase (E3) component
MDYMQEFDLIIIGSGSGLNVVANAAAQYGTFRSGCAGCHCLWINAEIRLFYALSA